MSRSYKKPYRKDKNDTFAKKQASKKVRKSDISDGSLYKKVYQSWDICDHNYFDSSVDKIRK